jgi:hypothetical protein
MSKVARLEVVSSGARCRWTLEEKQRIVAESYAASRQVSATARRNGLSASQLFTRRRQAPGWAPRCSGRGDEVRIGGEKYLHRYLSEFDFRYSNRVALGVNDGERADIAIKGAAGKRLTYRQPN